MSEVERGRLTVEEETRIVAMLARGDSIIQVQEAMARDFRPVNANTVSKVRARNKDNFEIIKARFLEKHESNERAIKEKANKIINKKLDSEEKKTEIIDKARSDYLNEVIDLKEYTEILRRHKETTLTELVTVSKEMHHQSVEDPDKPSDKKDISDLVDAIRSGDEVKLQQIIFNEKQPE